MTLRVVDITQWYAPRSGGIRTYLHAKAQYARARRLRHALIVPGGAPAVTRVERSPVAVVPALPTAQETGYRLIPHPRPILRWLERLDPGVVVVHDATAFPRSICRWARSRGVPVVLLVHSELQAGAAGAPAALRLPAQHVLRSIQQRGLDGPDAVIATAPSVARRLNAASGVHVLVSPLGVDTDVFRPRPADPVLRRTLAEPNQTLLLHVGRISSDKHPELLIEMLAALHDDGVVLAIAGAGSAARPLEGLARDLGVLDAVRFLGHVDDRATIATLCATADAFVHANPGETFGLAPLEALACGTRVVVPADAGVTETPAGALMTRVAPGDPAALAAGVRSALLEPPPRPDLDQLGWAAAFDREWALYGLLAGRAADATVAA